MARQLWKGSAMKAYMFRVGIALSILINVTLGGKSNQTFSARNYQRKKDGKRNVVKGIDRMLGEDHCLMCWTNWRTRK